MAEELKMEEGSKRSKLIIIIVAVVILIAVGGGAAYFFLMDEDASTSLVDGGLMTEGEEGEEGEEEGVAIAAFKNGTAIYVAMPRPFIFNVYGSSKDRYVEIKVELMMRGSDNEEKVKMHTPLIEGALLKTFSASNADDLVTEAGKTAIRDRALKAVQKTMLDVSDNQTVEEVLFTGFIMQ
jgi:flagellar FliL protein